MLVGRTLRQRYQIIERLGGGGFGDTYLAVDLDFPGKPKRVVKHLLPRNSAPEAVAIAQRLFKTEAECLSRLGEHERIPRLYSYFEEEGQFYLVQDFIEGHNLSQEFQTGKRWGEVEAVNLMQELLEILTFVHQENTIHRDLKPANIMRRQSDERLVLIDFGAVVEILTVDERGETDYTVSIGTPPYMAPEQATGRPGKYSDVYAVGMLGIQALTGLAAKDLPQDADRLRQILEEQQLKINSQLEYVLSRLISFHPQNRFTNAAEALQALIPTEVEETKTNNKASKSFKKLWLAFVSAIALLGVGIYARSWFVQPDYSQLEENLQNKQWQKADRETDRLLLKIAGENSSLDAESIANLSCSTLEKIDRLWIENSNGRFGFSPQKQVYLETGNQIGLYTETTYQAFGNKVGWRTFGSWSLSGDLKFSEIAPVGHLPSPGKVATGKDLRVREREMLLSYFDKCGL